MQAERRILIICYSRSETTAEFAGRLADELNADFERVYEENTSSRRGIAGFVRAIIDTLFGRLARLQPMKHRPLQYDVVVVATPVWAGRASTPIRTWLAAHHNELHDVAFFCTMGGSGSERAFGQMQALARRAPIASCAVSARDVESGDAREKLARFAVTIHDCLTGREAQPETGAGLGVYHVSRGASNL
ncbi:flavodoxin [Paraburkholderia azotifigens]|uniref:flavodoxin family protein n=1 Tax=Paraburkholderia azotifigens TaxID=2057004 RepID=UPI00317BED6A